MSVPLPQPFAAIDRVPLLFPHPPTIEPLSRLSAHLTSSNQNGSANIYVKREDMNSGLGGGGGNKLRKLEYVLADALSQEPQPRNLVTEGGVQSNHVRQVTAAAAKLGFETTLVIKDLVPDRSKSEDVPTGTAYNKLGNVQFTEIMGAEHVHSSDKDAIMARKPDGYWIPSGASTHPFGGLGYARWAFEIEQQESEIGVHFGTIVVALMSGSTLAGMVAGFKLAEQQRIRQGQQGKPRQLIGILAGPKPVHEMEELVKSIANSTGGKIGLQANSVSEEDFKVDDRYHAGAYGLLDEATKEGIKLAARLEGLITDPVYSGKALTALCDMVKNREVEGNILFVHTGGVLSASAYSDLR